MLDTCERCGHDKTVNAAGYCDPCFLEAQVDREWCEEMNLAIAARVFDHVIDTHAEDRFDDVPPPRYAILADDGDHFVPLPNYVGDANAAIRVINALREKGMGWYFQCTDLTMDSDAEWWSVHFHRHRTPYNVSVNQTAGTFERAVCLAAIKALDWEQMHAKDDDEAA